jgi:hypothetical protein
VEIKYTKQRLSEVNMKDNKNNRTER